MTKHDPFVSMMAIELALRAGTVPHEPASRVGRPKAGGTITLPIEANGYAIAGLDLILDQQFRPRLCELNGSNMAASSFGEADGDLARARHQVAAARARLQRASSGVILVAYARGTGAIAEILTRAWLICAEVRRLKPQCQFLDASLPIHDGFAVVVDTVEAIGEHVSLHRGKLHFRGLEVLSAANPNLLPHLLRIGVIDRDGAHYLVNGEVFHDGRLLDLVHDKHAQQQVAIGTGIVPIESRECHDQEACVEAIRAFQAAGKAAVAKMNGGSGGCGIEFFETLDTDVDVRRKLDDLLQSARLKYEGDVQRSIWPIRIFEFVESTGYLTQAGRHLWDLRVLALISPGRVDLSFCGIRLCPEPFTGRLLKPSVLSNVTGRAPDLATTRSPLVEFGKPTAHLLAGGVDEVVLERIALACAQWCQAAWTRFGPGSRPQARRTLSTVH